MMNQITSKDGTAIGYARSGTGAPLLLVHGGAADHTRWAPVLPGFEGRYTVYCMDRRGRGGSPDSRPYSIEREFEDIAAMVDGIGGSVNLVGHSFGAACALEAALLTPNMRRLVLYEPPPTGIPGTLPAGTADRMRSFLERGDGDAVIATFLSEVALVPPQELAVLRSSPSWQGRVAAAGTLLREIEGLEAYPPFDPNRFAGLEIPVLLLLGGDSPPFYREGIEALHSALPDSRIVVMPDQRHIAMNTAPGLFVREVLEFLEA